MRKSWLICFLCFLALLFCIFLSITLGEKSIRLADIRNALGNTEHPSFGVHVIQARIPRTIFGILAGAALSISGALMQAITRNPIADPSILGVNTGASLFVVCGISFWHITTGTQYIWLAFLGALVTSFLVFGIASVGQGGAAPIKLALAGAAANIALQSIINTIMLPNAQVMEQFRFWQIGSIGGTDWKDIIIFLPYLLIGLVGSLALAPSLNTLLLGDEAASGLGLNVRKVRLLGALFGVLLCGSVTALAGPIGFLGLMIPHFIRLLLGADMRIVLPLSALAGSCLLLLADTAGRLLGSPGELETGIITALAGAPVFIMIVRKAKVRSL